MKLVAALIIRNELHRYLEPCIHHLLEFCDVVVVWDDGSTDGWVEPVLTEYVDRWPTERVLVHFNEDDGEGSMFRSHAQKRQALTELALSRDPDWILAIDADEFIADGLRLRAACEATDAGVLQVCLQEVWNADPDLLLLRQDGGWVEHDVGLLWSPPRVPAPYEILDRGPATGRTPQTLSRVRHEHCCTALLHFGWANPSERVDRHHRYVVADGGRFHNGAHLESILWPDNRLTIAPTLWPEQLGLYRDAILAAARASD